MTGGDPEDFGGGLRLARERAGVTLRHIADVTKLSVRTLESLERNRISQLPGGIYRRAIVRAYASHVGLDPERTLRTFLALHPDDVDIPASSQPVREAEPVAERPVLQTLVNVITALIMRVASSTRT
jgi:cytoskeletal protein RodZ